MNYSKPTILFLDCHDRYNFGSIAFGNLKTHFIGGTKLSARYQIEFDQVMAIYSALRFIVCVLLDMPECRLLYAFIVFVFGWMLFFSFSWAYIVITYLSEMQLEEMSPQSNRNQRLIFNKIFIRAFHLLWIVLFIHQHFVICDAFCMPDSGNFIWVSSFTISGKYQQSNLSKSIDQQKKNLIRPYTLKRNSWKFALGDKIALPYVA